MHTIKAAVFQGTTQSEFKDRREFSGSLFRQMDEAYDFIDFRNQTHSTFDKLYRIDRSGVLPVHWLPQVIHFQLQRQKFLTAKEH